MWECENMGMWECAIMKMSGEVRLNLKVKLWITDFQITQLPNYLIQQIEPPFINTPALVIRVEPY